MKRQPRRVRPKRARTRPHRVLSAARCARRSSSCGTVGRPRRASTSTPATTAGAARRSRWSGRTAAASTLRAACRAVPATALRSKVEVVPGASHNPWSIDARFNGGVVMRGLLCLVLVMSALCGGALSVSRAEGNRLEGEYVEARTASVFAGACHYNGELTTAGREAVLAWSVREGSWGGVSLAGVRAVAVVGSQANLADSAAARRSEVIVDSNASAAQAAAFARAVESAYGAVLGRVVEVRRAP